MSDYTCSPEHTKRSVEVSDHETSKPAILYILTNSQHRTSTVFAPKPRQKAKGWHGLVPVKENSRRGSIFSLIPAFSYPPFGFPILALELTVERGAAVPAWAPTVLGHEIEPNPLLLEQETG